MANTTPGEAVLKTYLVTVVETYRIEADSENEALAEVQDLRPSTRADTVDMQVEEVRNATSTVEWKL